MPGLADLHKRQFFASVIGPTTPVVVGGGSQRSAALALGARYVLCCPETDVWIVQGGAGANVTNIDGLGDDAKHLGQGDLWVFNVDDLTNNRIAVMAASGVGGTLRITRIDSMDGSVYGSAVVHERQFYQQFIGPTVTVAVGNASQLSAALAVGGRYAVRCVETDVYLRQGDATVVASNAEMYLPAGVEFVVNVDAPPSQASPDQNYVAVMAAQVGAAGTLRITRIDQAP